MLGLPPVTPIPAPEANDPTPGDRVDRVGRSPQAAPYLARRLRVVVPGWLAARVPDQEVALAVRGLRTPARVVRAVIPVLLMAAGGTLAVTAAILAERPDTEGVGTLGTELGAAIWFAGAMAFVVSRVPTVGRALALVGGAVAGLVLIAAALTFGWDGAGLALAMEFGVAAVALLVIDVVLMGLVYPRVDELASGPDRGVVTLRLGGGRPSVEARRIAEPD